MFVFKTCHLQRVRLTQDVIDFNLDLPRLQWYFESNVYDSHRMLPTSTTITIDFSIYSNNFTVEIYCNVLMQCVVKRRAPYCRYSYSVLIELFEGKAHITQTFLCRSKYVDVSLDDFARHAQKCFSDVTSLTHRAWLRDCHNVIFKDLQHMIASGDDVICW